MFFLKKLMRRKEKIEPFIKKEMPIKEEATIKEEISEQEFGEVLNLLSCNITLEAKTGKLDKLYYICDAFGMLPRMNHKQCTQMVQALAKYMSGLKRIHYIYIYQRMRNNLGTAGYGEFTSSLLKDLCELEFGLEEKIILLGLASFHPNGYCREIAVEELIKLNHPQGLKFVLIRCSDYVETIRNKACEYITKYITYENRVHIIQNIDYVQYIGVYVRSNKNQFFYIINEKIEDFYNYDSRGMTETLLKGLEEENDEVQEYCMHKLVTKKLLNRKDAIELIKTSKKQTIIAKAINLIIDEVSLEELLIINEIAAQNKLRKTQVFIIERLYNLGYFTDYKMLRKEIISPYRCIRECARYVIKEIGQIGIREFYKQILEEANETQNIRMKQDTLIGLCEIADKEDIPLLTEELGKDYNKRTKKCLIETISHLDFGVIKEDLLEVFEKGEIKDIKYVSKIFRQHLYELDKDRFYKIYKESQNEDVRVQAAVLLSSLRIWERIIYIIEFCGGKDPRIKRIGKEALRKWWMGYENPPKGVVEQMQNLYQMYDSQYDEETKNRLDYLFKNIYKYYIK